MAHVNQENYSSSLVVGRLEEWFQPSFPASKGVRYYGVKTQPKVGVRDGLVRFSYVIDLIVDYAGEVIVVDSFDK